MTSGTGPNAATAATSLEPDERWRLVQRIMTSPVFAKSARMRALLSFLMMRQLSDMEETISERAIAVEVFRRDALRFDPASDRVVWLQMDRLRDRLAQHYALYEPASPWQITIRGGELVPVIVCDPGDCPAVRVTIALGPVRAAAHSAGRRSRAGRSRARASWPRPARPGAAGRLFSR